MRILWNANYPAAGSGYGTQTALFTPRLAAAGHDVAIYANWGVQGFTHRWQGLTVYPGDGEWGNRTMAACAAHHSDGILSDTQIIALLDAWVLKPQRFPEDLRLAVWTPVDHDPCPSAVAKVLSDPRVTPIAMSRFGERAMRDAGLDPLYVPHGYDPNVFRPQPEIRAQVRHDMNIPANAFVVGMVAANKGNPAIPRKAFPQVFQAFKRFHDRHPNSLLYCHTAQNPEGGGGIPLGHLARAVGLDDRAVRFCDSFAFELGIPNEAVAQVYAAIDVLANPSMGEGFGIPILEAQACGTPVIVSRHSAMTELCSAGWLVDGDPWYDALQDSFYLLPSIDSIDQALEKAWERRGDPELEDLAVDFAQSYAADRVMRDHWAPTLAALEPQREVGPLPVNRQQRRALAKAGR